MAQTPQHLPRAFREQPGLAGAVMLEDQQPLPAPGQAVPAQQALHRARGDAQLDLHRRTRVPREALDAGNRSGALASDSAAGFTGR